MVLFRSLFFFIYYCCYPIQNYANACCVCCLEPWKDASIQANRFNIFRSLSNLCCLVALICCCILSYFFFLNIWCGCWCWGYFRFGSDDNDLWPNNRHRIRVFVFCFWLNAFGEREWKKDNDNTKKEDWYMLPMEWWNQTKGKQNKTKHIVCSGSCFYFFFAFVSNHRKRVMLSGLNINIWDRTVCIGQSRRWRKQWRWRHRQRL